MHSIKSRAWNEKQGMHYGGFSIHATGDFQSDILSNDSVVMLSTGLLDKHGKEIYRGDIFSVAREVPQAGVFEVRFEAGSFWKIWHIQGEQRYELLYPIDQRVEIEVIGNIFENTELFKS